MAKRKRTSRKPYNKRKFYKPRKRVYRNSRDYLSPEYSKWRKDIKDRDSHRCQWPGCLSSKHIQVHHIKTWAQYPGLRFVNANGITLCRKCHDSIKGKEADYEAFFLKILEWQMIEKIKKFNKKKEE